MKTRLLLLCTLATATALTAQTTVLDFEADATSANYVYFGNGDLNGTAAAVIDNPDTDNEVNSSDKVLEFVERGAGDGVEPFAGAFPEPTHAVPVDLTVNTTICMDVWMPVISNVAVKLEESTSGVSNWVRTVANTKTNEWEQLCWNTNLPGLEDAMTPASGGVFNKVVLFAGFQAIPDTDLTYYFDNLIVTEGAAADPVDVTFAVDLNDYDGDIEAVTVGGTFNDFSREANPLTDEDEDGLYTGTVTLNPGSYEYKFSVNGEEEEFTGTEECVNVTIDGDDRFINRTLTVGEAMMLDTVCFSSCYACGESVRITFNLGVADIDVSDEGVYLAGGGNFGNPGDNRLTDDDGDGVYSITVERPRGDTSYYTYTNGACADYSCKEVIEGLPCASPENFNDRRYFGVQQDTVISNCFGNCLSADCATSSVRDLASVGVDFSVRPTVATAEIALDFGRSLEQATVRIFDVSGRALKTVELTGASRHTLDVSGLSAGYYMVQLDYAGARGVQRVVKQ